MALTEWQIEDATLIGGMAALVNGLAIHMTVRMQRGIPLDEVEILRHVARMEGAFVGGNFRLIGSAIAGDYLALIEQKETL